VSRFSVGNLETLKELPTKEGIDTRDELIKWYEKNYSANLMKLCILGSGMYFFQKKFFFLFYKISLS
jgi:insulysin